MKSMPDQERRADAQTIENLLEHVSDQFRRHGALAPSVALLGMRNPQTGAELGEPAMASLALGLDSRRDPNWRRALVEKAALLANACDAFFTALIVSGGERAKGAAMEEHSPCVLVLGTNSAEMYAYRAYLVGEGLGPFKDVSLTHSLERLVYHGSHLSLPRSELVSRSPREILERRLSLMHETYAQVFRGEEVLPYACLLANLDEPTGEWRRHEIRLEPTLGERGWRDAFLGDVSERTIYSRSDAGFVVTVCGPGVRHALRDEEQLCILVFQYVPDRETCVFRAEIQRLDDGLRVGAFYPWDPSAPRAAQN